MVDRKQTKRAGVAPSVLFKKSTLAMCVMAISSPLLAQTGGDEEIVPVEEIYVTGMRSSLQHAQDIKRDADTFVDSITASDIGALPDRSVLEAMQRLPGVSIEWFAGVDDPDHFGVEGSGVVIRGLTFTRSEFNGRDSFTANSGRGLNFQDVPPELMGGVDLYKSQTADMIEGGIGGTVSLRTRRPFDQDGRLISVSGDVSWGDLAREATPTISGLYSDRWSTDAGEFGLLLNVAYSSLKGESHMIQSDAYVRYDAAVIPGAERFVDGGDNLIWMPNGSNMSMKFDDRERRGFAGALQWESPDETLLTTLQFMRSDARLSWTENAMKYQGGYYDEGAEQDIRRTRPLTGTEFLFDDDGIFQAGVMVDTDGWRTADGHLDRVPREWTSNPLPVPQWGHIYQTDTRWKDTRTIIDDYALNVRWTPTDQWEFSADIQYIEAVTRDDDVTVMMAVHAIQDYDTRGSTPSLRLIEPWNGLRDENPELYGADPDANPPFFPGFSDDPMGDANYFQTPANYYWQSAMDHYERSEGDSIALRFDGTHHFEGDLIRSIKAGVRYAEREQTVRSTGWDWGGLGPRWQQDIHWADRDVVAHQPFEFVDWSNLHRGGVLDVPGGGMLHPTDEMVREVASGARELLVAPGQSWEPVWERDGVIPGTFFLPSDVYDTTEKNQAIYVRVDFGSEVGGFRFDGNAGLRYVKLDRRAIGSIQFPDLLPDNPVPSGLDLPEVLNFDAVFAYAEPMIEDGTYETWRDFVQDNLWASDAINYLPVGDRRFGNNFAEFLDHSDSYDAILPSLNVRIHLTDDLQARVGVARAIAYPDMELVRNQANLGARINRNFPEIETEDPDFDPDDDTVARGLQSASISLWDGSSGNPFLQPMESDQAELSLEWYFAPVGSLTGTVFYKDLSNFFIHGAFPREITNPSTGETRTVEVTGTENGGDGSLRGFEIAYQQFYDFLPAPWDGLGFQANYTWVDSKGVPNAGDDSIDFEGESVDTGARVTFDQVPLQGQSRHTFNIVGMYEKEDWSFRLAYNWRSRYLLTTRDVISKYPIWNDAAGFLDGSLFYDVNDNIRVGLQANNLLNTQVKTIMELDGQGTRAGRSWFTQDRRVALVLRASF